MESLIKSRQNRPFAEDYLEREIAAFYKAFNDGGSDPDIECLRLFLMIDLIKHRSPMQPRRQVAEVGELMKKQETIKLFQSQRNFVGSFSRRFLQFSDYEMPQSGRSDRNTLARFIGERKNLYIKVLCTELDRLSPSVIDYFNLMETLPDAAGSWKLYKGYSLGKVHEKEDSFFTPILTGFFAERIFNSDVFLDHEFTRLSIFKKAFILSSEFRQYTAAEDSDRKKSNKHYNRFVYLLDTITDKSELEKVTNMIVKQFFRNSNHLTLRSSLKLMKMMNRVSSPNGISNDSCKAISEYLLLNGANKAFFEGQDPEESVDKLIKCLGLCDKVKVWYFLPVLLNYSRRFHKFEKDIVHDNVARYIFDVYNKLLLESAHDHPSNQKSRHRDYVSGVFLSNKFIMRQTGVELFRSDRALVEYILDRRINWVSRLDPRDCDTFFAPKIGIESIVIEFLVGTYLKSSIPRVSVEDSKLGMDERSFFEIQDLLDAATVRKVYENGVRSDEERTHKDMQDTKLSNLIDAMLDSKDTPANESLDMQTGQEFEDVYSNLLDNATDLELEGAPNRISSVSENDTKTEDFFEQRIKPNTNAGYRALTVDEKLKEMRLYSTLRLKSLMVEEFVSQRPEYVDQLVRKYYEDYNGDIPLTLIHSMMLGILKCKNLELDEKIEKFKNLEKLGALIFDSNKKFHFRIYVRFKDVHIALINAIIDDSLKTNSGSLDILSWGFKKFINTPNVDKYSPWMKEWMKRLNIMREQGSGFWNAEETRSHSWGT
ncbi:DEKNAAC104678 [Brettanomyces naardenensis]|uniref:DEKNAAC104678 n=1 Tax=Brettanomyces naardenensis TaxID=13370 RepID=A0A448YRJ7_BRENA|nr:DEKNAAC104678 [Brettanomyces naardenensis]